MDVDRLMRDLTVEQLENIQQNLDKEMEGKRENLREMVGRRYRDVLEASSEVRNVCSLADKLATDIANTKIGYQTTYVRTASKDEKKAGEHFYAVNYLVSNIGSDAGDPLDDVVALCVVEHLQKQLINNQSSPMIHKVARILTNRIVATRSELDEMNVDSLRDISRVDWATNQLSAIAVLKAMDIEQLLELYLRKRYQYIEQLIDDSASILSILEEIKKSLTVVEELFVHGELQHAIQSIYNGQYRCEIIREMCADQAFSFEKTISEEMEKVWRHLREKLGSRGTNSTISTQRIAEKCNEWIEKTCNLTHRLVFEVCEYFENLDQVIELLQVITNTLRQDWPRIGTSKMVYDTLLKSVIIDKATSLLIQMIECVKTSAKNRLHSASDGPSYSIFDERSYRSDSQSHIGISTAFHKSVNTLWESLETINEKCLKFEAICLPMSDISTPNALKETIAENVYQLLLRLCEVDNDIAENECSVVKRERNLSRARLALAIVHSEASLICTLLDKDSKRITTLSQRLHAIIEDNLSSFCVLVARECLSPDSLAEYVETFEGGMYALRLITELQTVELPDVGEVHVPIVLSPVIHSILFEISSNLSDASIAHLLSKKMKKKMAEEISSRFSDALSDVIESATAWPLPTRTTLQVLFDVQFLNLLFGGEKLQSICSKIELKLDPFDVSLLSPLVAQNVKLNYIRSQILFSNLVIDTISNKDIQLAPTYTKVQDIIVRFEQPSRIPMIPRLDRAVMNEDSKKNANSRVKNNKYLANQNHPGSSKGSAPSLSAFYDRISSSWFGANN